MIQLPEKVKIIIQTLQEAGCEAYAVGGCIRDSLLGRTPDDWDITTSAKPAQIKDIFQRTADTGIQHGTVTVLLDGEGFEVTTFRIDGEYEDSRHPREVTFTSNLSEDLKRRDFTINAMAYNEQAGLVDLFHGREDMQKGLVRCVGEPGERFREDALRMMRAIRFSAQLGYAIEPETAEAIRELAPSLSHISAERIQTELVKLVVSPHPEYLGRAYEMGVTKVFFPEWDEAMETRQNNPHHCYNVGEHMLRSMAEIKPDKVLRLTMMLHDIGKPKTLTTDPEGTDHFYGHAERGEEMARQILRRLKFDNETIRKVSRLVLYHDYGNSVTPDTRMVRRAMNKIGTDIFPLLLPVKRADMEAQSSFQKEQKQKKLKVWEECCQKIQEQQQCVTLKDLAVTGRDLIAYGMAPGRELGETLQQMLETVLDHPEYNTKEYLLSLIK